MTHPLPCFPPLFPPGGWWRIFMGLRLGGANESQAIAGANERCGLMSRHWMRMRLVQESAFSFSVKGGASTLKNKPSILWVMAEEAERELPRYAATLATLYGRTPFHHLLAPDLMPSFTPGAKAGDVCIDCFRKVLAIILPDQEHLVGLLRQAARNGDSRLADISDGFGARFNPELSIVDAIMHLGPDAIFPLVMSFKSL